jgi:hypothetical protein
MEIDKRADLSYQEFAEKYLFANKPVILTNACKHWAAVGKWSPDFFKDKCGDTTVTINDKAYTVREYIDILHASTEQKPAPYMRNQNIAKVFPELLADVKPVPPHFEPNWVLDSYALPQLDRLMRINSVTEVYIGGPGGTFPVIHFDSMYTHACLTQLYGQKELYLWAPDQSPYMYATKRNNVSDVNDAENPDLEKYPLFAKAVGGKVTIGPGDTAFIPSGWWHTARMLTESITVSVNVVNASNWDDVSKDIVEGKNPLVKGPFLAYMKLLGKMKRARA